MNGSKPLPTHIMSSPPGGETQQFYSALRGVVEGRFEIVGGGLFTFEIQASNFVPKGMGKKPWKMLEDVPPSPFNIKKLVLRSILKEKELPIDGKEMRKRALLLKVRLGLSDGVCLLEHQNELIKAFPNGGYVVLAGTLLYHPDGHHGVVCLYGYGNRWVLCIRLYEGDWVAGDHFLCRESP